MTEQINRMTVSHKGFTLIEVIVALGVFSIALAALPALLVSTIKANVHAMRVTAATNFAQDRLEAIRNTPYANVTSGYDQVAETVTDQRTQPTNTRTYIRTWMVTPGPTTTTKQVVITVAWTDPSSRYVTLNAIVGG